MTFLHVYVAGFASTMGLCAVVIYPHRAHAEIQRNLLTWTIGALLASALWPLILIAALVAATDQ